MRRRLGAIVALAVLVGGAGYARPGSTQGGGVGGPIVLTSQSTTLPDETATLPDSAEIVTINCTACHSPEMILTQPRLKPEQWQAEVAKMRGAYKATIDEQDDAKIVAALVALQK